MTTERLYTFGSNKRLLQALASNNVRFLIVGGLAVQFHGCRETADDLDVMLDPTLTNGENLIRSLQSLGFMPSWKADAITSSDVKLELKAEYYADLLTPPSGIDFQPIYASSLDGFVNDVPVRIVALHSLIALKEITISRLQSDLDKHQRDLDCLRKKRELQQSIS